MRRSYAGAPDAESIGACATETYALTIAFTSPIQVTG